MRVLVAWAFGGAALVFVVLGLLGFATLGDPRAASGALAFGALLALLAWRLGRGRDLAHHARALALLGGACLALAVHVPVGHLLRGSPAGFVAHVWLLLTNGGLARLGDLQEGGVVAARGSSLPEAMALLLGAALLALAAWRTRRARA